jgi:hypothetical protein
MQTVYIRHNFGQYKEVLECLWTNRLIAIHYADIESTNPDDYEVAGKRSMRRLSQYCKSGAIVGAAYTAFIHDKMLVGEIEIGSIIKPCHVNTNTNGVCLVLKVVEIKNPKVVSYEDYPLLLAIQPRLGTVMGWPSAEKYLAAILAGRCLDRDVSSLAPGQLEVMCYEYLRCQGILKALLLPIGRTMMNVDIFGLGENGENVIAQVTQSNDQKTIEEKFKRLKSEKFQNSKLFFFGPEQCRINNQGVNYVAIEEVFLSLSSDRTSIQYRMLSQMLQVRN